MRKSDFLLATGFAALVGLLWLLAATGESGRRDAVQSAALAEVGTDAAAPADTSESLPEPPKEILEERTEVAGVVPEAEAADTLARCRVFGRVTDQAGRPVAGVEMEMHSVGGRWISKKLHPDELPEFETQTDAAGAFEFDTPLPTSEWISLRLRPPAFHTLAGRHFGAAGGRDEPPLLEGDNDLGTFVLGDAGAFEGRVLNAGGSPIPGAGVRLDGSVPGNYTPGSRTDDSGHYRVGHVPAGHYPVEAYAKGYLTVKLPQIDVANREITTAIDFVLERSPSLAGRVVDAAGNPLEDVRLWGWPASSGQGAGGRSAADGSFSFSLPQNESYSLAATLDGYEKFETAHGKNFSPGTHDIEVVLREPVLTTYMVREAEGDEPIEQFGLKIIQVRTEDGSTIGSTHSSSARVSHHPGGQVQLPGGPRFHDYTIVAPGYAPQRGRVEYDADRDRQQTIRLGPGGSLTGRFVSDGNPLPAPLVRLQAGRVPLRPGVTEGREDYFSYDWGLDMDEFAGRKRRQRGGSDGRFRIESLAAGSYDVILSAAGVAPMTLELVRVEAGETTDLGDIEAFPPGEIHGQVLLGGGLSPGALVVGMGSKHWVDRDKTQNTDSSGRFVFRGLAAGTHYLWFEEKADILVEGESIQVELAAGETKTVQLDLSERVPCGVEVLVRLAGRPAEGLKVRTSPADGEQRWQKLGYTNAEGIVRGQVCGTGRAAILVLDPKGLIVGESEEPLQVLPGGRARLELDLKACQLWATLPLEQRQSLATAPVVTLSALRADDRHGWQLIRLTSSDWQENGGLPRLDLGRVAPGRYRLRLLAGQEDWNGEVEASANGEATCALVE